MWLPTFHLTGAIFSLRELWLPCSRVFVFTDIVIGVFIDLKKAFDTVPHDILLKKMYAYGIRGNAFKLLKSYLTDRTQYVVYDSKQSETLPIKCGVPQGSILGPLLFICVMNDIGNVSDFLYTILYADDTCVL